jgi:hypothetical protein
MWLRKIGGLLGVDLLKVFVVCSHSWYCYNTCEDDLQGDASKETEVLTCAVHAWIPFGECC